MSTTAESPRHGDPTTTNDQLEQAAREYVQGRRAFQVHAAVFAAGMILIFVVNLLTNVSAGITGDWGAWWSKWAFLGWAIGISVNGLVVQLNRPSAATSSWEQKQIDKILSQ